VPLFGDGDACPADLSDTHAKSPVASGVGDESRISDALPPASPVDRRKKTPTANDARQTNNNTILCFVAIFILIAFVTVQTATTAVL
jgi:hypothetical protein